MGEYAELILNGDDCESCGISFHDEGPGYPRRCKGCKDECDRDEKTDLMEILDKFLLKPGINVSENALEFFSEPWSDEKYSYWSDGNIIARTQKIEKITRKSKIASQRITGFSFNEQESLFSQPPKVVEKICDKCENGIAEPEKTCPECDGRGDVIAETSYSDYEVECASCGGTGVSTEVRCRCQTEVTKVGQEFIQDSYLRIISKLPNANILRRKIKTLAGIPFIFDGGRGYVMPVVKGGDRDG
ncbi:hypothetical protein LCGC14_0452230 [marine sediment metagenome]|uniref:CR-type domain-containing protein n=1 Tax=marine sediment metagenome TaxID=412755 RepID=A0A0F9T0T1_9ZZZZ